MKQFVFTAFFICEVFVLLSQNIAIFTGSIFSTYKDRGYKSGHYQSQYDIGVGFTLGMGIDSFMVGDVSTRLCIQYDACKSYFKVSDGGQAGSSTLSGNIDKSLISIIYSPFVFSIKKSLHVNIGILSAISITESSSGKRFSVLAGKVTESTFKFKTKFLNKTLFGGQVCIAYDLKVSPSVILIPQLTCYLGFSNELDQFNINARPMRLYSCIGIKKQVW